MSRTLSFVKMSGTGNDFILVDNRDGRIAEGAKADLARRVCDRRRAVGGDGLILLEKPDGSVKADIRMRIFNSDGSEAEMCGNGARCLAQFAVSVGAVGSEMAVQTMAGPISATVDGEKIVVGLTAPGAIELHEALEFADQKQDVSSVNTGVPHVVMFVDDIAGVDVRGWGSAIRYHDKFQPAGTNANFVKILEPGHIAVRTYERGVEDETLACGTGSTASALVAAAKSGWDSPVAIDVHSGEKLAVHFRGTPPQFEGAALEGAVSVSFKGEMELDG